MHQNKADTVIQLDTHDQLASLESIPKECGEFPSLLNDPNSISELNSTTDNLHVLIALRKGVRT